MLAVVHYLRLVLDALVRRDYDRGAAILEDLRAVTILPAVVRGDEDVGLLEVSNEGWIGEEVLPALRCEVAPEHDPDRAPVNERDHAEIVLISKRVDGVTEPANITARAPVGRQPARRSLDRSELLHRAGHAPTHAAKRFFTPDPLGRHVPVHHPRLGRCGKAEIGEVCNVVLIEVRDYLARDRLPAGGHPL